MAFGKNVRRIRLELDIKQKELARRMGVHQATLSGWESDRRGLPEGPTLIKFATALNCSIDDLLVGVDSAYDEIVKQRDLLRHEDRGSSSAAHSQAQRKGSHEDTGGAAAARVLSHQLGRRKAFIKDVENVRDLLGELITAEVRRLEREADEAPAPAAQRRAHRRKVG